MQGKYKLIFRCDASLYQKGKQRAPVNFEALEPIDI